MLCIGLELLSRWHRSGTEMKYQPCSFLPQMLQALTADATPPALDFRYVFFWVEHSSFGKPFRFFSVRTLVMSIKSSPTELKTLISVSCITALVRSPPQSILVYSLTDHQLPFQHSLKSRPGELRVGAVDMLDAPS